MILTTTLRIMAHPEHTSIRPHTTESRPSTPQCATSTHTRTPRLKGQLWTMGLAVALSLVSLAPGWGVAAPADKQVDDDFISDMVPSQGAQTCLPNAKGQATIKSLGQVESMQVKVNGLTHDTEFDLFVIQISDPPFGLSWYQGDLETDAYGRRAEEFVGRFSVETFIVAPGSDVAPVIHEEPIPDAETNPETGPVHTFHLGLWFDSPEDAAKAGCADAVTPFNGEHNTGIQVLNTSNYPKEEGPLSRLQP
jgi:hypothetical protein